jgi:hypothetical protein
MEQMVLQTEEGLLILWFKTLAHQFSVQQTLPLCSILPSPANPEVKVMHVSYIMFNPPGYL